MLSFAEATQSLLSGPLSQRAQGFLLVLPLGATGRGAMAQALTHAYGTTAHPDVYTLESESGGPGKIDDVRRAMAFAHTHPSSGRLKTLWVPEADALTPQAANAFLKTLEEPSGSTRVILGVSRPERLLPTTRSRCLTLSVCGDAAFARSELSAQAPDADTAALDAALAFSNMAIDAAGRLLRTKGGLDWAKAADTAIAKGAILPVPTGGVNGLDAPTVGLVIHTALARAVRTGRGATDAHIDAALPYLTGLDRPGLDLATRVRALARALQNA